MSDNLTKTIKERLHSTPKKKQQRKWQTFRASQPQFFWKSWIMGRAVSTMCFCLCISAETAKWWEQRLAIAGVTDFMVEVLSHYNKYLNFWKNHKCINFGINHQHHINTNSRAPAHFYTNFTSKQKPKDRILKMSIGQTYVWTSIPE